jgi:hypothetical protein
MENLEDNWAVEQLNKIFYMHQTSVHRSMFTQSDKELVFLSVYPGNPVTIIAR